jgi:hypothetical protein
MDGGFAEQRVDPPAPFVVRPSSDPPSSLGRRLAASNCALVSMVVHLAALILLALLATSDRRGNPALVLHTAADDDDDSPVDWHGELGLDPGELSSDEPDVAVELAASVDRDPTTAGTDDAALLARRLDLDFSAGYDLRGDVAALGRGGGGADQGDAGALEAAFVERLARFRAKTGDVQISLMWSNYNDIDLHVLCPSGEHIYFGHRTSRCGGELDVDMNVRPRQSRHPVENIYWPAGSAPSGEYVVIVDHYRNHHQTDPTAFDVRIEVDGESKYFHNRIAFGNKPIVIHRFRRE